MSGVSAQKRNFLDEIEKNNEFFIGIDTSVKFTTYIVTYYEFAYVLLFNFYLQISIGHLQVFYFL